MSTGRTLLTLSVLMVFGSSAAYATPISYSEAVSGDLPGFLPAPTVFAFDLGVNTISGTFDSSGPSNIDSFAFSVPLGTLLTAVEYSTATTTVGGTTAASTSLFLDNDNAFLSS